MNFTQNFELIWPKLKQLNNSSKLDDGTGEMEKFLSMLVLGLGSFLSGMLPAIISERNRIRFPLVTSLMLCFGAGILLATSLIHILPEVREKAKKIKLIITLIHFRFESKWNPIGLKYHYALVSSSSTLLMNLFTISLAKQYNIPTLTWSQQKPIEMFPRIIMELLVSQNLC